MKIHRYCLMVADFFFFFRQKKKNDCDYSQRKREKERERERETDRETESTYLLRLVRVHEGVRILRVVADVDRHEDGQLAHLPLKDLLGEEADRLVNGEQGEVLLRPRQHRALQNKTSSWFFYNC